MVDAPVPIAVVIAARADQINMSEPAADSWRRGVETMAWHDEDQGCGMGLERACVPGLGHALRVADFVLRI